MIESILGSKAKVRIIRKMFEQDREIWFSDLARLTGLSTGAAHPALKELLEARILKVRRAGKSAIYSLNKSHFLFPEIKSLFESEMEMPEKIAREFARSVSKAGIKNIILFGSLARGEFGKKSDIDVLIVFRGAVGKVKENVYKTADKIIEKYDLAVSATYLSEREVAVRLKRLDDFILKALNEGKILFGDEKWLKK